MDIFRVIKSYTIPYENSNANERRRNVGLYDNELSALKNTINERNINKIEEGVTPLLFALKQYFSTNRINENIIKLLLDSGADPNIAEEDRGYTPLMFAIHENNSYIIKLLLDKGADINYVFNYGVIGSQYHETILMYCLTYTYKRRDYHDENKYDAIKILVENDNIDLNKKNNLNDNVLTHCTLEITLEELLYLFTFEKVNRELDFNHKNDLGSNALLIAIEHIIKYLENYDSILVYRFIYNLLERCDVNNVNIYGDTPLTLATQYGDPDYVKLLFNYEENKPNIDYQEPYNKNTVIHETVLSNNIEVFKILLTHNANLELADKEGVTPLLSAIELENVTMVKLLLDAGANKNHKDKTGKSATDYAKECESDEIKEFFEINAKIWKGSTKQDMELYDTFFESPLEWSNCPVCLQYIERNNGCMYMAHDCNKSDRFYHKELYEKYKFLNYENKFMIEWCTVCGRISKEHKHYIKANSDANVPTFAALRPDIRRRLEAEETFVFFEDENCKGFGGGGVEEKAARFRRLREYAKELQEDIDVKTYNTAMKELVEEVWNAPLFRTKKIAQVLKEKKFNIPASNFPNNSSNKKISKGAVEEALEANAVNIPYEGLMPEVVERSDDIACSIMASAREDDNENTLYKFHHEDRGGIDHSDSIICKDDIDIYIKFMISDLFGNERFGKCFDTPCNALLYPKEVKNIITSDTYDVYRKLFNSKMAIKGGKFSTRKLRNAKKRKTYKLDETK